MSRGHARRLVWIEAGCSRRGRATAAWGRRLPLAVPMNERLLVAVGHPKAAIPLSASSSHSVACLNVREGSRPAVRGKLTRLPLLSVVSRPGLPRFRVNWKLLYGRWKPAHRLGNDRGAPRVLNLEVRPPVVTLVAVVRHHPIAAWRRVALPQARHPRAGGLPS